MSNILAFGGWFNSGNLGDKAILEGIKKLFAPHTITTLPDLNLYKMHKAIPYFKCADLVLMTGGTPFYDYNNLRRFIKMVLPHVTNKKLILFGVGTKRLVKPIPKQVIRYLVNHSHSVYARDSITKNIFKKIGITKDIEVTGDSAFALEKKDVRFNGGGVAVCPRKLSRNYKKHYHEKLNVGQVRQRFFEMVSGDKRKQYLIPFHTEEYDNDLEEMELYDHGEPILDNFVPSEMLGLLSNMEHVYGLRLHSLIMAFMMGVPFSTVDYDIKIKGFKKLIGNHSKDEILKNIQNARDQVLEDMI